MFQIIAYYVISVTGSGSLYI